MVGTRQSLVRRRILHFWPILSAATVVFACTFGLASEPTLNDQVSPLPSPADSAPESPAISKAELLARDRPLGMVNATVRPKRGELPTRIALTDLGDKDLSYEPFGSVRPWMMTGCEWDAPGTCNLPLFYEEPDLERLGYTRRCCLNYCGNSSHPFLTESLQVFVSGINFVGRVPLLPYAAWAQCHCEPIYTLGVDRPEIPELDPCVLNQ